MRYINLHFTYLLKFIILLAERVLTVQNGKYGIGDGYLFNSLSELVNHYRRNTMKDKSGIEVTLKQVRDCPSVRPSVCFTPELRWCRLIYRLMMYRVAQKSKPVSFLHIFANYWPIFIICIPWKFCSKVATKHTTTL